MVYGFDTNIAQKYGVDEAIFVHNLYFWIVKNEANGRHFYDGKYWTYNSAEAFVDLFPFWTPKQVRRIIDSLAEKGAIYVGNYNAKALDRTKWYALNEEIIQYYQMGICILPNGQMELPKQAKAIPQTGTPIPDNKPNSKPNDKPPRAPRGNIEARLKVLLEASAFTPKLKSSLSDWLQYKGFKYEELGFRSLLTVVAKKVEEHGEAAVCELIVECMSNSWRGIIWDKLKKAPAKQQRSYD